MSSLAPGCPPGVGAAPPAPALRGRGRGRGQGRGRGESSLVLLLYPLASPQGEGFAFCPFKGQPHETLSCLDLSTLEDAVEIPTLGAQ